MDNEKELNVSFGETYAETVSSLHEEEKQVLKEEDSESNGEKKSIITELFLYRALLSRVLNERVKAQSLIVKSFREFARKKKLAKDEILSRVIKERLCAIKKIKENITYFRARRLVKKIKEKENSSEIMLYYDQPCHSAKINILGICRKGKNCESSMKINMNYCWLRKIFVCYLTKELLQKDKYYFYFIIDGQKMCSLNYPREFLESKVFNFFLPRISSRENLMMKCIERRGTFERIGKMTYRIEKKDEDDSSSKNIVPHFNSLTFQRSSVKSKSGKEAEIHQQQIYTKQGFLNPLLQTSLTSSNKSKTQLLTRVSKHSFSMADILDPKTTVKPILRKEDSFKPKCPKKVAFSDVVDFVY